VPRNFLGCGDNDAVAEQKKPRVPVAPRSSKQAAPLLTRKRVIAVVAVAVAVAIVLVVASLLSARGGDDGAGSGEVTGAANVESMLQGIPQDSTVLGRSDAPVTLVEYADLQCPFCAEWARATLPQLVSDYVKDGRLKIEFRGLTFIGPDSETALRSALAAGDQQKLWNVVDLLYVNQGEENSGWVSDDFLRSVGEAVPGLDVDRMLNDAGSNAVTEEIARAANSATAAGVTSTPWFEIGKTGGELSPLEFSSLGPPDFKAAIDQLLNG
jgi:protein-disulfide isomerase